MRIASSYLEDRMLIVETGGGSTEVEIFSKEELDIFIRKLEKQSNKNIVQKHFKVISR